MSLRLSSNLELPAEAVTQTFAILAKRGVGKSYLSMVMVEEMLKSNLQVVYVDPIGIAYGLRTSADGKNPGYPIIIAGGEHGDVPLESTNGQTIADLIVDNQLSMVIDLSLMRKGEQKRFMIDFAETLYHRNRTAMHLVLDEADEFCMSADTQILTPYGWRSWNEVKVGDEVVSFDLEKEIYRNEAIQRVIVKEHDGEMINLKTKSLDCLVTPDHRVVLRRVQRAQGRYRLYDWTFCPAAQVPTCIGVPCGGAEAGPGIPDLDEESLRIMGWVISDGYFHDKRKSSVLGLAQAITSVKGGLSIAKAMDGVLMAKEGVTRCERPARECIGIDRTRHNAPSVSYYLGRSLSGQLHEWLNNEVHRIPRRILREGSPLQLRVLYRGLMEGDGTVRNGWWSNFYPGNNEGLADDFQELATRLGINTTKSQVIGQQQWVVHIANERKYHWIRRPKNEHYKGIVWDITVPSGAFVARRNGKVFVTGNCPQRPMPGDQRLLGAIEDLVRRGRARGIGVTLITQRPAVLNKNVLTQIEVLVAMRLTSPQDRNAINEWVRYHADEDKSKEMVQSLPSLPIGTAWFWSPGWLDIFKKVAIRKRETFDSSSTPEVGVKAIEEGKRAIVKIDYLREKLAETIQKTEENDPKKLKARIRELENRLISEVRVEVREIEVVPDFVHEAVGQLSNNITNLQLDLEALQEKINTLPTHKSEHFREIQQQVKAGTISDHAAAFSVAIDKGDPAGDKSVDQNGNEVKPLSLAAHSFLNVLAQYPSGRTKSQISILSGYSKKSSSFSNALSQLRSLGLISPAGMEPVTITEYGRMEVGDVSPIPKGKALISYWLSKLSKAEGAILSAVIDAYPLEVSYDTIASYTGYSRTSSSFSNALSKLRSLDLISGYGNVKASNIFFEEGA